MWDTVEPFDAVQLVRKCIKEGCRDISANKLVDLAIEQRSMDNISILVIFFDFNEGTCTTTTATSNSSNNTAALANENENVESSKTDGVVVKNDQKLENVNHNSSQDKDSNSGINYEKAETLDGST